MAEVLFSRLTEQQKDVIRRMARNAMTSGVQPTTQTNLTDTTNAAVKTTNDLARLERIRQKIIVYLEEVRRDALTYQHRRTELALSEATRFIEAYMLCKRDPSPNNVDIAWRRGEHCLKVLSELYGSK
jgi:hypothetical protein